MIQKRVLTTALLVVGLLVAAAAQEVQVTYQDGMVEQKSGAAWTVVSIGDKLSASSTLKLDKNSTLELKSGSTVLVISQAGTYALKDILAARKKTESNGVAKSLQASFGQLTGATPVNKQSTVAGVRAKQQGSDQPEWATGDIADTMNDGKSFLKNGQYKEALEKFNSAMNEATESEAPELYYLIAYSQTLMGDIRPALKQLANVKAVPEADWAGDYILLKARLLEEGFAWTEAIAWLTKQGASLATDVNRGPLYHFLLGLAYSSSGDNANAKTSLNKVISLGKDTDLGKAAASLLQN